MKGDAGRVLSSSAWLHTKQKSPVQGKLSLSPPKQVLRSGSVPDLVQNQNMNLTPWLEPWQTRKIMTELLFEPTPRWKGAPPICLKTNFPSFDSERAALAYHERHKAGNPLYE